MAFLTSTATIGLDEEQNNTLYTSPITASTMINSTEMTVNVTEIMVNVTEIMVSVTEKISVSNVSKAEDLQEVLNSIVLFATAFPIPWLVLTLVSIALTKFFHAELSSTLRGRTHTVSLAIMANHSGTLLLFNITFLSVKGYIDSGNVCGGYLALLFYFCMVSLEWLFMDKIVCFRLLCYLKWPPGQLVKQAALPIYMLPAVIISAVELVPQFVSWPVEEFESINNLSSCLFNLKSYAYFMFCAFAVVIGTLLSLLFSVLTACHRVNQRATQETFVCAQFMHICVFFSVIDLTAGSFVILTYGLLSVIKCKLFIACYVLICVLHSLQGVLLFSQYASIWRHLHRKYKARLMRMVNTSVSFLAKPALNQ